MLIKHLLSERYSFRTRVIPINKVVKITWFHKAYIVVEGDIVYNKNIHTKWYGSKFFEEKWNSWIRSIYVRKRITVLNRSVGTGTFIKITFERRPKLWSELCGIWG